MDGKLYWKEEGLSCHYAISINALDQEEFIRKSTLKYMQLTVVRNLGLLMMVVWL